MKQIIIYLKTFAFICILYLLFSACSDEVKNGKPISAKKINLQDGVYIFSSGGNNGIVELQTTVKNGAIFSIDVLQSSEKEGIGGKAIFLISKAAIDSNSINIDGISGATITSSCVKRILKETLLAAGASKKQIQSMPLVLPVPEPDITTYSYDVIVIGAGGAGLTAALTAREKGARVAVLEKNGFAGGNTQISGGALSVPGTDLQMQKGIRDSPEQFIQDIVAGGDNKNDITLIEILTKNALGSYEWLRDNIGVAFQQNHVRQFGGHSVPRTYIPEENSGDAIIRPLLKKCEDLNIDFFYNTKAVKLIRNYEAVNGIIAKNNKTTITFYASRGVILATGGFGANLAMREQYNPNFGKKYKTTCLLSSSGDGITMAQEAGAKIIDMEYIQVYPACNPLNGTISYVANARFDGAVLVNKEGKRFTDEGGRRDVISQAILAQTDGCAYLVWGNEIESIGKMTELHAIEYKNLEKNKLIIKADSLKEAAAFFGIDEKAFSAEIEKFNTFAANKKDTDFNKTGALRKIETGPFFIQKVSPATHHTMGGLAINEKAQVKSADGGFIKGLYAAGEVTGGIHGTNRLGGNAITDIITFGRIAGQNAAE
ncbi:flavocytochrome c [Treponema sp. OMZ 840]|uniref:flavocytochrome c n=1 Tax=Treponema sp. OMZ 840 TaxID=244313 RepID=UPI003D8BDDC5